MSSDCQGFGKPQGSGVRVTRVRGFCKGYSRVTFYFKSNFIWFQNFISQNSRGMWVRVPRVRVLESQGQGQPGDTPELPLPITIHVNNDHISRIVPKTYSITRK